MFFLKISGRLVAIMITVYQKTISLDHGLFSRLFPYGYCRYHPTCSEYSKQAFLKYGAVKGAYLSTKRVFRCHPWALGGEDPLL
ncbi:MAG: membrane protein insertion efficiency factor YidD [bacterium]